MQSRFSTRRSDKCSARVIAVAAATVLTLQGCSEPARAFGSSAPAARANADGLFGAFAQRFGPLSRDERLLDARPKLLEHFLTPASLYADDLVWSSIGDSTRTLAVGGGVVDSRYLLAKLPEVADPARAGDARHVMALRQVSENVYEWDASDQLAVGTLRSSELRSVLAGAMRSLERRDGAMMRALLPLVFPRASATLGALFSIEGLETRVDAEGATTVEMRLRMDPERMQEETPKLAEYLSRYVASARWQIAIDDEGAVPWLRATADRGAYALVWRTRDGELLPLEGPAREVPDRFILRVGASIRVLIFTIGVSNLEAELSVIDEPHARGWEMRFRDEPDWHLPLITEHLLRTPLRRPFEGEGALLRYVARDGQGGGGQTVLERDIRIRLQESGILRWLNRLGNKMASDLDAETEAELLAFTRGAIVALHRDVVDLLPPSAALSASRGGR